VTGTVQYIYIYDEIYFNVFKLTNILIIFGRIWGSHMWGCHEELCLVGHNTF
jgi:hypothetical protein